MALNWNQEVSIASIKKLFTRKKGDDAPVTGYPTKTTMNLYQVDETKVRLSTVVLAAVLGLVVIVAVLKFGILDPLTVVGAKQAELERQQQLLAEASAGTADYAEITELYEGYQTLFASKGIDAIAVLDLVERVVKPTAKVSQITFSDYMLTLTLNDVPLDTVGTLAKQLETQSMVQSVNVSTATTTKGEGRNTIATLVITLVHEEEEK